MLGADAWRRRVESLKMEQSVYCMDAARRQVVLAAIQERCRQQNWTLFAAHVRTNHVHLIVEAESKPARVMNDVKSYASRCLNQVGLDKEPRKRWARHGSTRWLWTRKQVSAAISYVVEEQGQCMAVFEA